MRMLLSLVMLWSMNSANGAATCPAEEAVIGKNCWTLKDQKYLLDNSQPMNGLCKAGYKVPSMEDYIEVQKSRMWPQLQIQSKEHYLTSTTNDKGHYYFVNYYGADNGFFAEPRGSGTYVHARCFKVAEAQSIEEEVLSVLKSTAEEVLKKSGEEFSASYAKVKEGSNSVEYTNVFNEVKAINAGKSAIVNALGLETAELFNHAVSKAEAENTSLDGVIIGSYELYEKLRVESGKTVTGEAAANQQLAAHSNSAMDIVKDQGSAAVPAPVISGAKKPLPSVKSGLISGNVTSVVEGYRDMIKELESKGTLNAANLLAGVKTGSATNGSSSSSVTLEPKAIALPSLDTKAVERINEARKASGRSLISLGGSNSSASAVASSGTSSITLGASSSTPATSAVTAVSTGSSVAITVGELKGPENYKSNFKIEKPGYQLEPYFKTLDYTDPTSSHLVTYLRDLEDLINYIPLDVNTVVSEPLANAATIAKRNKENNAKEIEKFKFVLYGPVREEYRISKQLEVEKNKGTNKILIEELNLKLGTIRDTIYNRSKSLLLYLHLNAENVCPKTMTLSSPSIGAGEDREYVCKDSKGTNYLLKFGKVPTMRKLMASQEGLVELGKSYFGATSIVDFQCPTTAKLTVFDKEVVGKFHSVVYQFSGYTTNPIKSASKDGNCVPTESGKEYALIVEADQAQVAKEKELTARHAALEKEYLSLKNAYPNDRTKWASAHAATQAALEAVVAAKYTPSRAPLCAGNKVRIKTIPAAGTWSNDSGSVYDLGSLTDAKCSYIYNYNP